ncbi:MAG: class I SAM-dependent methyltransferase [Methanosarcinales archaeon]|nr:class I SAM-dependent methyltransferase [Methanosarcinales archaeon]
MLLHDLLGLREEENVFLAEECLEDLIDLPVTGELMTSGLEPDRAIVLGEEKPLAVALHLSSPADFWLILTDIYSQRKVLEGFLAWNQESEAFQVLRSVSLTGDDLFRGIAEYYSLSLMEGLLCDECRVPSNPLHVEDRIQRLQELIPQVLPRGFKVLDVGCGSGMGTRALTNLGYSTWAMDVDRCEVCQGLKNRSLIPDQTFVMDARLLDAFLPACSFDAVVGFMMGLIDDVNRDLWRRIVLKASSLARTMVFYTVYTRKEAEFIAETLCKEGWTGEIIDNSSRIAIYDQWAYLGWKPGLRKT